MGGVEGSQGSATPACGLSPCGAGEFQDPGGHREPPARLRAPPMGQVHKGQEESERWYHAGDRLTRPSPGYGVGCQGRTQVTEVSKDKEDLAR